MWYFEFQYIFCKCRLGQIVWYIGRGLFNLYFRKVKSVCLSSVVKIHDIHCDIVVYNCLQHSKVSNYQCRKYEAIAMIWITYSRPSSARQLGSTDSQKIEHQSFSNVVLVCAISTVAMVNNLGSAGVGSDFEPSIVLRWHFKNC